MNPEFDTIIVGAGLAGSCAALHLSRKQRVLVLEANPPMAAPFQSIAGLANPLMGRRARAVWHIDEALAALHDTLEVAGAPGLFQDGGILRPAVDARQAQRFRETAAALPHHAEWLSDAAARERYPGVSATEGALFVRRGGSIRVPDFMATLLASACRRGAELRMSTRATGWGEDATGAFVTLQHPPDTERIYARRILLTMGYGYHHHPELRALNLHAIKGQVVRVAPQEPIDGLIPLSGRGYVVPVGDTLVVGSSYERSFTDLSPSLEQTEQILAKASLMLPALAHATVLDALAGVRVTVPGTRLPMLGPLPGCTRCWIFSGMGSKGFLMAPLLARDLLLFFEEPDRIPPDIRISV
ncbi:MAG: NAD(P)/FAD-dependent oxidoreductase [Rhodothermales bacterium]